VETKAVSPERYLRSTYHTVLFILCNIIIVINGCGTGTWFSLPLQKKLKESNFVQKVIANISAHIGQDKISLTTLWH
jgi:hypothetical protein